MKTNFIMVPDFVKRSFLRANRPLSDIIDIKAVSKVLSLNDAVHLLSFQDCFQDLIKDFVGGNQVQDCYDDISSWRLRRYWGDSSTEESDAKVFFDSVCSLTDRLEQVKRDNAEWYFTEKYKTSEKPDVDLVDLGNVHPEYDTVRVCNTVACIAEKGCFATSELRSAFILKCVKRAYGYEDLSDIARSDLFFAFLHCLKKQ